MSSIIISITIKMVIITIMFMIEIQKDQAAKHKRQISKKLHIYNKWLSEKISIFL